jgi:hypothetical protein
VGRDQIEYPGDKSTRNAGLTTAKILINSVISTKGARFLVVDIKNFYLNTPPPNKIRIHGHQSIISPTGHNRRIQTTGVGTWRPRLHISSERGVWPPASGHPHEQIITTTISFRWLSPYQTHTHGLWKHETRPVWFSLVVNDFGIKYIGRDNTEHLMASIKRNYHISSDWTGSAYWGLKPDLDYINGTVDLSMPGYMKAALHKYQHPAPKRPEQAPHQWNPPVYGSKTQYVEDTQDSPALSPKDVTHLQHLVGTLLNYAQAVDPKLIMPVNVLASE